MKLPYHFGVGLPVFLCDLGALINEISVVESCIPSSAMFGPPKHS